MEESIIIIVWRVIKLWYWVFLPFLFLSSSMQAWLWWRRELWEKRQKYILLELIPPAEISQPFPSMEQVFSNIWGIHSSLEGFKNIGKKWGIGKKLYHFCLEIISIGNKSHLLIRCFEEHGDSIKAALYAQFPDLEITEVEDYTKFVPYNIPNKEWDMYGFDTVFTKPDVYPIKTYTQFFEKKPETVKEEKRIDPLSTLLEGMAELKPEEQLWVQIKATPVTSEDNDYIKKGRAIINKLTYRDEKKRKPDPKSKEEKFIPPEMKLTVREREIVNAIETKIGKQAFEVNIRCLYLAKKGIFKKGRKSLAEQFFTGFSTQDLNGFKKWRRTKTRIYFYHLFIKRFGYLKKRQIFRRYLLREPPLYPSKRGVFILNTEELATIFHLPFRVRFVGTYLPRVGAKRGEAPPELPTESESTEEVESEKLEINKLQQGPPTTKREPPSSLPTQ